MAQLNLGLGNAHGLQVVDIRRGSTVNIDPQAIGVRGDVRLQQLGFNGWTVTREPYAQPNGSVSVPVHKNDAAGNPVYIDSVPFDTILSAVGGRRRRTGRHRRRVTRRSRRRHSRT